VGPCLYRQGNRSLGDQNCTPTVVCYSGLYRGLYGAFAGEARPFVFMTSNLCIQIINILAELQS
jgi:hypothetical protein